MPKEVEEKLKEEAENNPEVKDKDAYVYGTMQKKGLLHRGRGRKRKHPELAGRVENR